MDKYLEKDLKEILSLSTNETIRTKNAFIDNKLIKINADKTITVNKKYCNRGLILIKLRSLVKYVFCI